MKPSEYEAIDKRFSALLGDLDGPKLPCSMQVKPFAAVKSCIQRLDGKRDKEGRTVLWFAVDCPAARELCPAWLAYWAVAVARNAVIGIRRFDREAR